MNTKKEQNRLVILILAALALLAVAANPTFQSFDITQFFTTSTKVQIKSGAVVTNLNLSGNTTGTSGATLSIRHIGMTTAVDYVQAQNFVTTNTDDADSVTNTLVDGTEEFLNSIQTLGFGLSYSGTAFDGDAAFGNWFSPSETSTVTTTLTPNFQFHEENFSTGVNFTFQNPIGLQSGYYGHAIINVTNTGSPTPIQGFGQPGWFSNWVGGSASVTNLGRFTIDVQNTAAGNRTNITYTSLDGVGPYGSSGGNIIWSNQLTALQMLDGVGGTTGVRTNWQPVFNSTNAYLLLITNFIAGGGVCVSNPIGLTPGKNDIDIYIWNTNTALPIMLSFAAPNTPAWQSTNMTMHGGLMAGSGYALPLNFLNGTAPFSTIHVHGTILGTNSAGPSAEWTIVNDSYPNSTANQSLISMGFNSVAGGNGGPGLLFTGNPQSGFNFVIPTSSGIVSAPQGSWSFGLGNNGTFGITFSGVLSALSMDHLGFLTLHGVHVIVPGDNATWGLNWKTGLEANGANPVVVGCTCGFAVESNIMFGASSDIVSNMYVCITATNNTAGTTSWFWTNAMPNVPLAGTNSYEYFTIEELVGGSADQLVRCRAVPNSGYYTITNTVFGQNCVAGSESNNPVFVGPNAPTVSWVCGPAGNKFLITSTSTSPTTWHLRLHYSYIMRL